MTGKVCLLCGILAWDTVIVHSLDRIRKCASEKCALIGEILNVVG